MKLVVGKRQAYTNTGCPLIKSKLFCNVHLSGRVKRLGTGQKACVKGSMTEIPALLMFDKIAMAWTKYHALYLQANEAMGF